MHEHPTMAVTHCGPSAWPSLSVRRSSRPAALALCLGLLALSAPVAQAGEAPAAPCRLVVVEKGRGCPVPLIELRTTNQLRFVTDNAGVVAFDCQELMGQEVWFDIIGHGYGVEKDGFGNRGVRVRPMPGTTQTITVERHSLASCLGRLTGGGLFAEVQHFGEERAWKESGIIGCDSVQCVPYQGRLFWLWGDSGVPSYPLGIFSSTGATSALPAPEALVPPIHLPFEYVCDAKGHPRGIAPLPGDGPTWIFGMLAMKDKAGHEHLGGCYSKIKGGLAAYEIGLAVWNDSTRLFERSQVVWEKTSGAPAPHAVPDGQATSWRDPSGKEWYVFGNPFPFLRCPASFEAWSDRSTWEVLDAQKSVAGADGSQVVPHTGAIGYHPWRKRWVTVFMQRGGKPSSLGELWYAEADQATGPWGTAVKILSHENYTFYNPHLHLDFTPAGKSSLYFEGSYTVSFTGNQAPTPRYDYNQILYRLDLDDPGLKPAQ
jgi:hypothetical protein